MEQKAPERKHPIARRLLLGIAGSAALAWGLCTLGLSVIGPLWWLRLPWLVTLLLAPLAVWRFSRGIWISAMAAWLGVLVVIATPLTGWLIRSLATEDLPVPSDAVAALSVNIRDDGEPDTLTQNHLNRAYQLLRSGLAPILVVTQLQKRGLSYVPAVRRQLAERGLDCELYETEPITSTYGEVNGIRRLAEDHHWQRVLIVTDACHLKRTRALCHNAGLDALLIPSRHKLYDWHSPTGPRQRLAAFADWLYETYHYQENHLRGWL